MAYQRCPTEVVPGIHAENIFPITQIIDTSRNAQHAYVLKGASHNHFKGRLPPVPIADSQQCLSRDALDGRDIGICKNSWEFDLTKHTVWLSMTHDGTYFTDCRIGKSGGGIGPRPFCGVVEPICCGAAIRSVQNLAMRRAERCRKRNTEITTIEEQRSLTFVDRADVAPALDHCFNNMVRPNELCHAAAVKNSKPSGGIRINL